MNHNLNVYRLLRIARDKTVKEVADNLLVTPAYINAIESGNRKPSVRLLRDYARVMNIDENIITSFDVEKYTCFEMAMLTLLEQIIKT